MSILNSKSNADKANLLLSFTQGIDIDKHLADAEIRVQSAWAQALCAAQFLSPDENSKLQTALQLAQTQMNSNTFNWQVADEDIHMNLERFLTEQCGELGKKIHLGRSRNDLIATTLRLWVSENTQTTRSLLKTVIDALVTQATQNLEVIVPGLTHVQHGQPLPLAQLFLAHAQAFTRDVRRIENAQSACLEAMPLGAAACAGTHLQLDFKSLADSLGFSKTCQNSYDAVGDRDFILESLQAYATLAVHLGRLCEEFVFYCSTAVGLLQLPKDWSTGSSIMPNKRNPDVLELIRAKSARIIAAATEGAYLVKSVIPSYGSDLHELKRTFLRAQSELLSCLTILQPFVLELSVHKHIAERLLQTGHILATDFANQQSAQGKTFREAYHQTKLAIERADATNQQIHETLANPITFAEALELRDASGGSSREQILKQIQSLK